MSADTEAIFSRWLEDGIDPDDFHVHFDEFGRWHWVDVAEEGCRVFTIMFPETPVVPESPIGNLFHAVAAQASEGAIAAVAACLGLNERALVDSIYNSLDNQDNCPKPVGIEGLRAIVEDVEREHAELDAGFDATAIGGSA